MPVIQFTGFAPDLDPVTPGVITDCSMLVPTLKGMKGAPGTVATSFSALASEVRGAAVVTKLDASTRFFAGLQTKLYEGTNGATWTDRSRAGNYTGGAENRWRFAQFGDVTIATNKTDTMQYSTTGAFADLTIKAAIVETVGQFVFAADTNESTYGDAPNRWWCSELGNYAGWTPNVSTQCATGILTSVPGSITAAKRLGADIVVYKARGMYLGRYAGPPTIWDFGAEVPGTVGTPCNEAVVDIGTAHIFIGYEDFYRFDGTRPEPIGAPVREWFFRDLNPNYRYRIRSSHDRVNSLIYFYYPNASSSDGSINACIVYNYKSNKWGRANRSVDCCIEYITGGVTYEGLGSLFTTYDSLPTTISYDSPFFTAGSNVQAIFDSAHTLYTLTGNSASSSVTSGDMGSDELFITFQGVRLHAISSPTSATLTNYYKNNSGDALTTDQSIAISGNRFDFLRDARYHRFSIALGGQHEITGFSPMFVEGGTE